MKLVRLLFVGFLLFLPLSACSSPGCPAGGCPDPELRSDITRWAGSVNRQWKANNEYLYKLAWAVCRLERHTPFPDPHERRICGDEEIGSDPIRPPNPPCEFGEECPE